MYVKKLPNIKMAPEPNTIAFDNLLVFMHAWAKSGSVGQGILLVLKLT